LYIHHKDYTDAYYRPREGGMGQSEAFVRLAAALYDRWRAVVEIGVQQSNVKQSA
jgi:hypothetical protein